MNEIVVLRADYYSDGTIVPILLTYSDGRSEIISSIKSIRREDNGKKHIVHCTTVARELTLCFQNAKWSIENVKS